MFGLLSAMTYALFILGSGRAALSVNPLMRSSIMSTGSMLTVFAIYPPKFFTDGTMFEGLLVWGFLLAFFGVLIPILFFSIGIPKIGAAMGSILGAVELPMAVFMSTVVLGEYVTPVQWTGVAVILIGIALPELSRKRLAARAANAK
ncbi:EamA family transporter [Brevibacillus sp. B_LB10_24]|uniref:EamA family transporter n=1 Tax=Brevibacillus sp. B_LB10_24 TaxID=3380645 RepID=UPI0038B92D95